MGRGKADQASILYGKTGPRNREQRDETGRHAKPKKKSFEKEVETALKSLTSVLNKLQSAYVEAGKMCNQKCDQRAAIEEELIKLEKTSATDAELKKIENKLAHAEVAEEQAYDSLNDLGERIEYLELAIQ